MKKPIIAAQLYTVRDLLYDKAEEEIRETLGKIRDIGYTAIQISGVGEPTAEKVEIFRKVSEELGLDICATHLSIEYIEDNLEWVIELHKIWDCHYIGIGSMPDEYRSSTELSRFVEKMNIIGHKLKDAGLQLIYHNHKFEFELKEGKPWLEHLLDAFDPKAVQLELDTYWVQAGGGNPVKWIQKVAGNSGVLHLKDYRIVKDEPQFAEVGYGNLDWVEILEVANKAGVIYAAVEQDAFTDDPIQCLKMSYDYLQSI